MVKCDWLTRSRTVLTIYTSLLVPFVDEQVSRTLWEPGQGQKLNEAGNGITGKQVLPARFTTQNLSLKKTINSVILVIVCACSI